MWLLGRTQIFVRLLNVFSNIIDNVSVQLDDNAANDYNVAVRYDFPAKQIKSANVLARNQFHPDFLFGVMTSAYPTEGAWNVSDKTESDWDYMTHAYPDLIFDRSNGDIAANSFYKYKEDIELAKSIGSKVYRLSLSWTRILPNGYNNYINLAGLMHYMKVIDEICRQQMIPLIVLFDKEMPYKLTQLGGFTNPMIIDQFVEYARHMFQIFGDKVKYWITINEPNALCRWSYGGNVIPSLNLSGTADYICGHNALLAHTKIYRMYQRDFYPQQKGKVGIAVHFAGWEPKISKSEADILAAERAHEWHNNWLVHPIFSEAGDYPYVMKQRIIYHSFLQDFPRSRLPSFDHEEIEAVKGSADFLGINYYMTALVSDFDDNFRKVSFDADAGIKTIMPSFDADTWLKNAPWAFGLLLRRIQREYDPPEVFITENGYMDNGTGIDDPGRVVYYFQHTWEVLKAIQHGLNIRGYLAASLIDGFQWSFGYAKKLGLFHVDFNDDYRQRTAKLSARMIADIYKTGRIRNIADVFNETFAEQVEKFYCPPFSYAPINDS